MRKIYDDKSWSFLIASPAFSGPVFEESVVLLLEDNEDGSFGIIINKSSRKTLGELNADFLSTDLADVEVFEYRRTLPWPGTTALRWGGTPCRG